MMKCICILINLCCVLNCFAFSSNKADKIHQLMKSYAENGYFNGTVLVSKQEKTIFEKSFGYANLESKTLNTIHTKFRIGSMTKPITATLVLRLIEEGKLSFDGYISDYLVDYPKDIGSKVTIQHLLNHSSGIPSFTYRLDLEEFNQKFISVDSFIVKYCTGALEFEPGSKFSYNNSGYYLLGAIIEKVTGLSYKEALQKYIFMPLKMNSSGYYNTSDVLSQQANGYVRTLNDWSPAPYYDMSTPYSTGGITSTVEDIFLWAESFNNGKLLSKESIQKTHEEEIQLRPGLGYANGWFVEKRVIGNKQITVVSHGGEIDGFNSLIIRIPEDSVCIILLNNFGKTNLMEMGFSILNILYDQPYAMPKKNINHLLGKTLIAKGIDETYRSLNDIIRMKKYTSLHEEELGTWSRYLLRLNRDQEAFLLMQFVVKQYPDSFMAHCLLGDIYATTGNTTEAVLCYQRALKLSPENPMILEKLDKKKNK